MIELILKIHNILYTNFKKNESIIILHCDYIFNKLIQAINNLLDEKKIYTNYIKYIANVLCKICKLSDLMSKISIDTQNNLIILTIKIISLLNDNKKDNNYYNNNIEENKIIIKCFNFIMLRIIDYGDINNNINILMNFEMKYRNKNLDIVIYVAKCLIIISENINKNHENIQLELVIENIYKLLEDLLSDEKNILLENKVDKIIMITIKKILYQIITYRGEKEIIEYIKDINKQSKFNKNNYERIKNWLIQYINLKKLIYNINGYE